MFNHHYHRRCLHQFIVILNAFAPHEDCDDDDDDDNSSDNDRYHVCIITMTMMTIIVSMSSGDLHFAYAMTVDDLEGRLYASSFRNPISNLTVEGNYTKVNVIASKYPLRRELATTRYSNWSMTHLTQ